MNFTFVVCVPATKHHGPILSTRVEDFSSHPQSKSKVITSAAFADYPHITSRAYAWLTAAGFQVHPDQGFIEFHEYTPGTKTPLGIHCDDGGAMPYPVETCIIYLQKDSTLAGGNLHVWDTPPCWYHYLCCAVPPPTHEIQIESGMVLLMSGDVYHRPQDVSGVGIRRSIVVQLRSKQDR